jgi:hypothetical protein
MNKTKLVQMNMQEDTLSRVDLVKQRTHSETTTGAIRMSIEIADMVTKTIAAGGKVILDNGKSKTQIVLPGVNEK